MPRFKVMLQRVDTITRQAVLIVEAPNTKQALNCILTNLRRDESSYDEDLVEVDSGFGKMKVDVRGNASEPVQILRATAELATIDHK